MPQKCEFCPLKDVHDKQCPAHFIPNPIFCERMDPLSNIYNESIPQTIFALIEKFPESANAQTTERHTTIMHEPFRFNPKGIPIFAANESLYEKFNQLSNYHAYLVDYDCESNDRLISQYNLTNEIMSKTESVLFFVGFNDADLWLLDALRYSSSINYQIDSTLPGFDGTSLGDSDSLDSSIHNITHGNYDKERRSICVFISQVTLEIVESLEKLSDKYLLKLITIIGPNGSEFDQRLSRISSVVYGQRNKTYLMNRYADIIITDNDSHPKYYDKQIILPIKDISECSIDEAIHQNQIGIWGKIKNFKNALSVHVANGLSHTSDEIIDARMKICNGCSKNIDGTCEACGCILSEKVTWATSECPLKKWSAETSEITRYQGTCGCGK